ncbi:MAG: hypothetical protein HC906_00350 [Bacteroidales bacterium]|nr:hypothetical protein [Bacteroidales bacterium]
MKKTIKIAIASLTIVFVFSFLSCSDDFYETKIGDRFSPDKFYNNFIDVQVGFLGVASLLQDILPNYVLVDGLLSDQMEITSLADVDLNELYKHNVTAGNRYISPEGYYKIVISANEC